MLRWISVITGSAGSFFHRSMYFASRYANPAKTSDAWRTGQYSKNMTSRGSVHRDLSAMNGYMKSTAFFSERPSASVNVQRLSAGVERICATVAS